MVTQFIPGVCRPLVVRAALILLAYGLVHLAGLRQCTTVLSGTPPEGSLTGYAGSAAGCCYLVLHLAAIVVAPILLIAAALLGFASAWMPRNREG